MKLPTNTFFVLLAMALAAPFPQQALGQTVTWIGGNGTWAVPSDWSSGTIPGSGTNAYIDSGTVLVTTSDSAQYVTVGDSGTAALSFVGGTLSDESLVIGNLAGSNGTVSAQVWNNTGFIVVGNFGTGTLNIGEGIVTTSDIYVASGTGSNGSMGVIFGGVINVSGTLSLGEAGTAILTTTNGGAISAQTSIIGDLAGSNGSATMSSGTWNTSGTFIIGDSGTGTLTLAGVNPTAITVNIGSGTGTMILGNEAGSVGTLNFTSNPGTLNVGTIASGSGIGNIDINANSGNYNFTAQLSGAVNVNIAGNGNSVTFIEPNNNYSGTTTISGTGSGSTLYIGNGGTNGTLGTGPVVDNGQLIFDSSGTTTLSNSFSGNGFLGVQSGAVNFNGNVSVPTVNVASYMGITGGTFNGNVSMVSASGSVVISGDAVVTSSTATFGGSSSGGATVTLASGSWTVTNFMIVGLTDSHPGGSGTLNINGGYLSTAYAEIDYDAQGTVNMSSGTWVDTGGGIAIGENQAKGATFNLTGGYISASGVNAGADTTVLISGGTLNANGIAGTVWKQSGGVVNTNTVLSQGLYTLSGGTWNNADTLTLDGIFSMTLTGGVLNTGTLTLASVSNQNLYFGNGGSSSGTLNGIVSGTLGYNSVNFNLSGTTTQSAQFTGLLALNVQGGGEAVLTGSNSYSGSTQAYSTLALENGGAINGSSVFVYSGGTFSEDSLSSVSGGGALTVNSGGAAVLSGSNSYNGVTAINGTLAINGGTLNGSAVSVTGIGANLIENGSGNITGAVPLTLTNGATAALSGVNTYTGTTTVNSGDLTLDFSNAESPSNATNIINHAGNSSALAVQSGTLTVIGGGNAAVNSQVLNGATFIAGSSQSAVVVNSNGASGVLLTLGALATNGAGITVDFTLPSGAQTTTNGVITTSTNLLANNLLVTKQGMAFATVSETDWASLGAPTGGNANIVPLSSIAGGYSPTTGNPSTDFASPVANVDVVQSETAPADLNGSYTINSIRFNMDGAVLGLQGGTNQILSGGILVSKNIASGVVITGGTIQTGTFKELLIDNYGNLSINSGISGAGTFLTLAGSGSTALGGNNTFTGGVTLNMGALEINSATALGTGTLSILGGVIDNTSGTAVAISSNNKQMWGNALIFAGSNPLNMGSGAITMTGTAASLGNIYVNGSTLTLNGVISGTNNLVKFGPGTLLLGGTNTYTGSTSILSGTLQLNEGPSGPTLSSTQSQALTMGTGTTGGVSLVVVGNSSISGTQKLQTITLNAGANQIIVDPSGATTTTLFLSSTFARTVGATLNIDESAGAGISVDSGTTTTTNGIVPYMTVTDGTSTGFATLVSGSYVRYTGTTPLAASGNNVLTNYNLVNNSITMNSVLAANSITFNATTSSVQLNLNQHLMGADPLLATGTNAVSITSGTITGNELVIQQYSSGTFTIGSIINSSVTVTKSGFGVLALTGANTYTGKTFDNAGTLVVSNSGSGTSSSIGTGTLVLDGGNLDASNPSGVALSTNNAQLWETDFAFLGSNSLNLGTGSVSLAGNGTVRTVTVDANTLTAGGAISGIGYGLTKAGAGTLILGGNNSYTGSTSVTQGTLQVNGSIASSSGVGVSFGATLGGSGVVSNISGAGTVMPGGNSILTASQVDPSGGLGLDFHFTLAGAPNYGSSSASGNDVLHLTGATPFAFSLTSANVITLDFTGQILQAGQNYYGGIFTDTDIANSVVDNATFDYTGLNGATMQFDGMVPVSSAPFATGTVSNGEVMEFTVAQQVPAAPAWMLVAMGAGLVAAGWRKARA
ncbi:MAG TPA: autotransporter-associated beta strand repeat-containing protein [Chthoniobacteraceae bacterium]|nr:autotransporter-associated beta strand repeat-containing protein [Chthoniobacteraceae bacterium]